MNTILRKTHAQKNIAIMKARDYYFNLAKRINFIKTLIVFSLPVLIAFSYIPPMQQHLGYSDFSRDIASGVLTLLVIAVSYIFDHFISKYANTSNTLREYYDREVLGVPDSCFLCDFSEIDEYLQKAAYIRYKEKYEIWYCEIFSDDQHNNVFCGQMDNILYAIHTYKSTKNIHLALLAILTAGSAIILSLLMATGNWQPALLVAFSLIECFDILLEKINILRDGISKNTDYSKAANKLHPGMLDEATIVAFQHAVIDNRSMCIFLPKYIRDRFYKPGNPYYKDLNKYKHRFLGDKALLPENDTQIEAVSEDGEWGIPLSDIHRRLKTMLEQVIQVFVKEGIDYVLDGGTLIGAMRPENQGFIPWDDDIDLAIPIDQIEHAKMVLQNHLPYFIQDVHSEPFYSPRLAAFRIREDNEHSIISEKDSTLFTKYQYRGLFLDIYAYSPILYSLPIDKLFRRLIIHPTNRRLKFFEDRYPMYTNKAKADKTFLRLKKRYLKWLSFYHKHAKNNCYYVYSPEYIHTYKKAGPYHPARHLFSEHRYTPWEGLSCRIPNEPELVLESYYGKGWRNPPFKTKQQLQQEHGSEWFSHAEKGITALKHISNVVSFSELPSAIDQKI